MLWERAAVQRGRQHATRAGDWSQRVSVSALVHLPVGIILGVVGWVTRPGKALVLREQTVVAQRRQLAELEVAERNLANQRWAAYILAFGWGRLTLSHTIRYRGAIGPAECPLTGATHGGA